MVTLVVMTTMAMTCSVALKMMVLMVTMLPIVMVMHGVAAATATFNADPVGISGWYSVGASGWGLAISGFEALGQRAPRHGIRLMAPFL